MNRDGDVSIRSSKWWDQILNFSPVLHIFSQSHALLSYRRQHDSRLPSEKSSKTHWLWTLLSLLVYTEAQEGSWSHLVSKGTEVKPCCISREVPISLLSTSNQQSSGQGNWGRSFPCSVQLLERTDSPARTLRLLWPCTEDSARSGGTHLNAYLPPPYTRWGHPEGGAEAVSDVVLISKKFWE